MSINMNLTESEKTSLSGAVALCGLMISLVLLAFTFALLEANNETSEIVVMALLAFLSSLVTVIAGRKFYIATK